MVAMSFLIEATSKTVFTTRITMMIAMMTAMMIGKEVKKNSWTANSAPYLTKLHRSRRGYQRKRSFPSVHRLQLYRRSCFHYQDLGLVQTYDSLWVDCSNLQLFRLSADRFSNNQFQIDRCRHFRNQFRRYTKLSHSRHWVRFPLHILSSARLHCPEPMLILGHFYSRMMVPVPVLSWSEAIVHLGGRAELH